MKLKLKLKLPTHFAFCFSTNDSHIALLVDSSTGSKDTPKIDPSHRLAMT